MVKCPEPSESTPPAFDEEAARQILREGFGVESSSLSLLVGERDQNFRVGTPGGQRFLCGLLADKLRTRDQKA
jgi:Ser/Thr protein kinase RdoA (MazF antagonist)